MARTDEAEATIQILGEDLLTATAAKAEKSVEKIGDKADQVAKGPLGRLRQGLTSIGELTFFTELNQGAELAGKAFQLLVLGYEKVREAAMDRGVAQNFARLFGDGAEALERLQSATQGLIADGALRDIATQGARAGLSLEQVSRLLESSTRAALGTGAEIRETADAFLKSVVESNDEATKQLGVLVDLGGAQAEYARSLGTTADKLTAAQKAQASLEEVTRQTDAAFQAVTGDAAQTRLMRLEARWANFTAGVREAALALTVGLPETVDSAVVAPGQAVRSISQQAADSLLDAITKGNYAAANIDRIAEKMRAAGHAQEAYRFQVDATARGAALLAEEEAKIDAVFAERQRHIDTLAKAERDRVEALAATVRKEDEARYSALEHARQLALVADAMGSSEQAGERWRAVLGALGAAHVSAADDVATLYAAVRASNSEIAKAIELEAELAAAAGDLAGAEALRAQALGAVTGDRDRAAPSGKAAGGGRRQSALDKSLAENEKKLAADQQKMWEFVARLREEQEQAALDAEEQARSERVARDMAEIEAMSQEYERVRQEQVASRQAGFDSLSDSILGLRDSLGELDGISLDGLASAARNMGPLIEQMDELARATDQSKGAAVSGALGIAAASGRMVAGLIKDQRAQAVIMALVEQAEAWGAFARYDYVGFAAHMVSSGIWAAVAGTSGGGGSGGARGAAAAGDRRAREMPRVPNESPGGAPQFAPVTIHISGSTFLGADADKTGRELARMIDRHRGRAFRGGDSAGPP